MTSAGSGDEKQPQQHKCYGRKRRKNPVADQEPQPEEARRETPKTKMTSSVSDDEKQPQQQKCSDSPSRRNPVADQDQGQEPPRPEEARRETPPADEEPSGPEKPRQEETPTADEEPSGPEEPRREENLPADEEPSGPEEPRREEMASSSHTGKPSHVSLSPETVERMKDIQDWPDRDENFRWTYDEEKVRRVCEIQKNMDINDLLSYVTYGEGEEVMWSNDVRNFPAITQVPEDKTVPPPREKSADSPADADSGGRASS